MWGFEKMKTPTGNGRRSKFKIDQSAFNKSMPSKILLTDSGLSKTYTVRKINREFDSDSPNMHQNSVYIFGLPCKAAPLDNTAADVANEVNDAGSPN